MPESPLKLSIVSRTLVSIANRFLSISFTFCSPAGYLGASTASKKWRTLQLKWRRQGGRESRSETARKLDRTKASAGRYLTVKNGRVSVQSETARPVSGYRRFLSLEKATCSIPLASNTRENNTRLSRCFEDTRRKTTDDIVAIFYLHRIFRISWKKS